MCVSPIRVKNPSSHWHGGKPLYLTVPCGHCSECCHKAQNDWFVRCYFEWLQHRYTGLTFFYTLTYNEEMIPRYEGVKCFSKRHCQLFIMRLRKRLRKMNIVMKYMICCEYGELLHRPHYHVLFFLTGKISAIHFYNLIAEEWCVVANGVRKSLGFVRYGDNYGIVNSSAGIRYVTKYVTKDYAHVEENQDKLLNLLVGRYNRLLLWYSERYTGKEYERDNWLYVRDDGVVCMMLKRDGWTEFEEKVYNKVGRVRRSLFPFHLQSTKLGVSAVERIDPNNVLVDTLPIMKSDGSMQHYAIPRYLKRKLWYDVVESETNGKKCLFVLNEDGLNKQYSDIVRKVEDGVDNLASMCGLTVLGSVDPRSFVDDDTFVLINQSLNDTYHFQIPFANKQELFAYLKHFDLDFKVLSIYRNVFRGRVCFQRFDLLQIDGEIVKDSYRDMILWSMDVSSKLDYGKLSLMAQKDLRFLESSLYDYHPYFQPYEFACVIFDCLELAMRKHMVYVSDEKDRLIQRTRQIFKKGT